jgi:hypothetical protein
MEIIVGIVTLLVIVTIIGVLAYKHNREIKNKN